MFDGPSKVEKARQIKNLKNRMKRAKMKNVNFYTIDTETDGFPWEGGKNEPVQIVATMHRQGQECEDEKYSKYFMPRGKITASAVNTHKLDLETLKEKGAK